MSTKKRILSAALGEFSKAGYAETSMRRLAELVGIQAASLYAHFPSKRAILDELLEGAGPASAVHQLDQMTRLDPPLEPDRFITELVETLSAEWIRPDTRLVRSMIARLGGELAPETWYLSGVKEILSRLEDLFESWMKTGVMHREWPPSYLAWQLMAPLGNLRTSFWNSEATDREIQEGLDLAKLHSQYFISNHLKPKR